MILPGRKRKLCFQATVVGPLVDQLTPHHLEGEEYAMVTECGPEPFGVRGSFHKEPEALLALSLLMLKFTRGIHIQPVGFLIFSHFDTASVFTLATHRSF